MNESQTSRPLAHCHTSRLMLADAIEGLRDLLDSGVVLPDHTAFNVRGTMHLLHHEMNRETDAKQS